MGVDLVFPRELGAGPFQCLLVGRGAVELAHNDHILGDVVAVFLEGLMVQRYLAPDGSVGLGGPDVEDVAAPGDPPHCRIAHRGLPDLGVWLLEGPGGGTRAGDVEVAAVVGDLILGPQAAHQPERLGAAGAAMGQAGSERLKLLRPVAQADAEDEAPFGDVVQGSRLLGDVHRVQQRQQQDRGGQLHVSRFGGQSGQHGPGLEVLEGIDQVMVAPAIDVEPGVARGPKLLQVVLPLLLMVDAVPLHHVPDLITNAHILTPTCVDASSLSLRNRACAK